MKSSSPGASVAACFRKYATFTGRAARPEYWWFVLFVLVGSFVVGFVDGILFPADPDQLLGLGPLGTLFFLATAVPSFAVGARRLHDVDKPAWWLLMQLIPLVGVLAIAFIAARPGTPGSNRFGPAPGRPAARATSPRPSYPGL